MNEQLEISELMKITGLDEQELKEFAKAVVVFPFYTDNMHTIWHQIVSEETGVDPDDIFESLSRSGLNSTYRDDEDRYDRHNFRYLLNPDVRYMLADLLSREEFEEAINMSGQGLDNVIHGNVENKPALIFRFLATDGYLKLLKLNCEEEGPIANSIILKITDLGINSILNYPDKSERVYLFAQPVLDELSRLLGRTN